MRYFKISSDHFESWIQFTEAEDNEYLAKLDASSLTPHSSKPPLKASWIEGAKKEQKWLDTHLYSPVFLVLSLKAAQLLDEFFGGNGFFIATKGLKDNYTIYNVTNVISNAFDWTDSDVKGDKSHLSKINTAAIFEDKIQGSHIFKLAESRVDIFVSESFKNKVENCNLTGFIFEEVSLL